MKRCACSVQALEAFVRTFAGIEVRSATRNGPRCFTTSSSSAIRQTLHTRAEATAKTISPAVDDSYIPFRDHDSADFGSTGSCSRPSTSPAPSFQPTQISQKAMSGFEPDIEIIEDAMIATNIRDESDGAFGRDMSQAETAAGSSQQVNQPLAQTSLTSINLPDQGITLTAFAKVDSHMEQPTPEGVASQSGRIERRKERKARRLQEGKAELQSVQSRLPDGTGRTTRLRVKSVGKGAMQTSTGSAVTLVATGVSGSAGSAVIMQNHKASTVKQKHEAPANKDKVSANRIQTAQASAKESEKHERAAGKDKETWQVQKAVLQAKFGDQGWKPRKRISPDALAGIRALHAKQPDIYTAPLLSDHFKVSPEAIRRILKGKWQPSEEEAESRRHRWEKRGERKWREMVEQGIRPPKKWREMGVGRAENGQPPLWKDGPRTGEAAGERWIEQPDADLFLRAADAQSERSERRTGSVDTFF